MSFLRTIKNLFLSFGITFCVYCGYLPLMMLQVPTFTTSIELQPQMLPMTLDEASLDALVQEALGTDAITEKGDHSIDVAGTTEEYSSEKSQPDMIDTPLLYMI